MTMSALLVMTDWQAIGHDPCTELSIFHNPSIVEEYKMILSNESGRIESYDACLVPSVSFIYSATNPSAHESDYDCTPVTDCPVCGYSTQSCIELSGMGDCMTAGENMYPLTRILCKDEFGPISCFSVDEKDWNKSLLTSVHLQSLKVVRDRVYEFAEKKCESVDSCQWIPNSRVTHRHCDDCQPICKSVDRTLNFPQFAVGLTMLMCTMEVMYIGMFLLLSDSVSKSYQVYT